MLYLKTQLTALKPEGRRELIDKQHLSYRLQLEIQTTLGTIYPGYISVL